jgi:F-box interacting protein
VPLLEPYYENISNILGSDFDYDNGEFYEFVFGYDNSTDTYKVVALNSDGNDVRVFTLGDNVWRTIKSFPVDTLLLLSSSGICNGAYLSSTVNWLACMRDHWIHNRVQKCVIVSLDLGTETYSQMLLPEPFDEKMSSVPVHLCVLKGLLCFYHDIKGTDFMIWQMKEFRDYKSWTPLLKVSYQNIQMNHEIGRSSRLILRPLHLSENGDTLVLKTNQEDRAILYNRRTNKAKKTRINKKIRWLMMNYVESLVSPS